MNWINLTDAQQLLAIAEKSYVTPQLLFKHSTRCSISSVVKSRLDAADNTTIDCYYLDLLQHRNISNQIATDYKVEHESPQIIVIKNGDCIYDESQSAIRWNDVLEALN